MRAASPSRRAPRTSPSCAATALDDDEGPLRGGVVMTGGFFLGPGDFYERLRRMPSAELKARIDMTRIDFINQLYGTNGEQTQLKRLQRVKARFMNTTMKVTLLGAAASDALESRARW